jgi:hypothetical protein
MGKDVQEDSRDHTRSFGTSMSTTSVSHYTSSLSATRLKAKDGTTLRRTTAFLAIDIIRSSLDEMAGRPSKTLPLMEVSIMTPRKRTTVRPEDGLSGGRRVTGAIATQSWMSFVRVYTDVAVNRLAGMNCCWHMGPHGPRFRC